MEHESVDLMDFAMVEMMDSMKVGQLGIASVVR